MSLLLGLLLFVGLPAIASAADVEITYNRDVRPILSDKCFQCHGPDPVKRGADLRLDDREAAVEFGAIVPGQSEKSGLVHRVSSTNEEIRMPPLASKVDPLTPQEVNILRRWIDGGATYEPHWAFVPVKPPREVFRQAQFPLDEIVKDGLSKRKLTFQPEASKETLIRRVTFDLTGLPPTPQEVEEFLADRSPRAYEKLVDRLLASPAFGERMAVDWLDLSRYADSYGFQVDRERVVWPWRDWVIKAFNENLPFDQFITWQLAGDLLPNATDEQILATAFNRLHQQECEGGSVEEEYRVEYVCDRVQTFATAFLGLTFECVRCHDHKYDPITQKEYYGLFSMFQNIDEAGLYSFFTQSPPTPTLALQNEPAKQEEHRLSAAIAQKERDLKEAIQLAAKNFDDWLANRSVKLPPGEIGRFSFDESDKNTFPNLVQTVDGETSTKPAVMSGDNRLVPGYQGMGVQFTGDDPVNLSFGNFESFEPFTVSLWLKTPDVKDRAVVFHRSKAWTDAASRGYELLIEEGCLKWSLIHFWPGNAISIRTTDPLKLDEWTHVVVTSDGSRRANGLAIYVNGVSAKTDVIRDGLTRNITGGVGDHITLGERFRDKGFKGGLVDEFRVWNRLISRFEILSAFSPTNADEVWLRAPNDLTSDERQLLQSHFTEVVDSAVLEARQQLQEARKSYVRTADKTTEIMVMRELPTPKTAYVLFRGEYDKRREEVAPGTPAVLSAFPPDAPKNRLGLARWLTDPRHPLLSRVTVNRIWQSLWGRGLVKTTEDFGSQGERPIYPELLDALAWQFMESGWNTKGLVKSIVMTEAYRQRSLAAEPTMADDPENQWLARGPRFRLSAEMIRDNSLAASGLLVHKVGGPPVFPYEMTEAFKPVDASQGKDQYRRSLYSSWRRTSPPPAMVTFDAPRRAVCSSKRDRTDSPLQALILLNGIQYVDAARSLGQSIYQESNGQISQLVPLGFKRCLSRLPTEKELAICQRLYEEQRSHFLSHPTEAEQFLKIGYTPRDLTIPLADAAAVTVLSQALLNHDECVVKH